MTSTTTDPHPAPTGPRPGLQCQCGCVAPSRVAARLAECEGWLQRLDELAGRQKCVLVLTSGYRCRARNDAIDGSKNSMHMQGRAIDFYFEKDSGARMPASDLGRLILSVLPDGGVGTYDDIPGLVHYDNGRAGRRWGKEAPPRP